MVMPIACIRRRCSQGSAPAAEEGCSSLLVTGQEKGPVLVSEHVHSLEVTAVAPCHTETVTCVE